jgi:hypothetical protein
MGKMEIIQKVEFQSWLRCPWPYYAVLMDMSYTFSFKCFLDSLAGSVRKDTARVYGWSVFRNFALFHHPHPIFVHLPVVVPGLLSLAIPHVCNRLVEVQVLCLPKALCISDFLLQSQDSDRFDKS